MPYLRFAFCAVIDGIRYKTGIGITKQEARHKAAELALQELLPTLEKCTQNSAQGSGRFSGSFSISNGKGVYCMMLM